MYNEIDEFNIILSKFNYILNNEEFLKLKKFKHHYFTNRYNHCINVAFVSFLLAKKFNNKNMDEIVKGALLHDFFLYDWRETKHNKNLSFLKNFHAFYHPIVSLENSKRLFNLTNIEKDIIYFHMFPCSLGFPKYKETIYIVIADKWCSIQEGIFKNNSYKIVLN